MAKKAVALAVVAAGLLALGAWRLWLPSNGEPATSPEAAPRRATVDARPAVAAPDLAGSPRAKERPLPGAGRPDAAVERPVAVASIRGLVRDEQGQPVEDAVVYALPKGAPGFHDLDTHPHAVTSKEGQFRFDLASPRGHWIGTVAAGRLPSFVDGDELDPATSLTILVKAGPEIAVRAVDMEGRPVEGATVYVAPASGEGVRPFPAPDEPGGASSMARTGVDGRVRVSASTEGPVDVGLSPPNTNLRTEPDGIRLERAGGQAEFRVVPSCALRIRVLDATTGRPFESPFGFTLRKAGTDAVVSGFSTSNPDGAGVGDLTMGLAPGTYDVEVAAEGRKPEVLTAVAFDRSGASRELTASLVMAGERTAGTMVLAWVDADDAASRPAQEAADPDGWGHEVLLRRTAPDRTPWFSPMSAEGFATLHEVGRSRFDGAHRITTIDLLVPGTYDVLAWHRAADRCAFARDVRVPVDNAATARLVLGAGVRVPMNDLVGPTTLTRGLVLEAEPLGRLPVFRWFPGGWGTFEPEDEIDPTYVLGPYPFATVTATFPGPDGAPKRVAVGAKAPAPR